MDVPDHDRAAIFLRQRKALADFGCYAFKETDLDKLLTEAARHCAEGLGVRYAKVLEYRPARNDLYIRAGVGWHPHVIGDSIARAEMSDPSGKTLLTGEPVVIRDINEIGLYTLPSIYPEHHIASAANVVILGEGHRYGVLEADSPEPDRFTADDIHFLQLYANIIASAVMNCTRLDSLQQAHDALVDVAREQQHRVRNNLQSIAAHLRTAANHADTDASRRDLDSAERHVFSLASLYDQLLGIELGAQVDLVSYLGTLFDRLRALAALETRPIHLMTRLGDSELQVDADVATALGTAVNELVANAIEHAFGDTGGTIELRLATDDAKRAIIQVIDDGRGMGDGIPPHVGLAVVRRLIERTGAELLLESKPGHTAWTITLPLR